MTKISDTEIADRLAKEIMESHKSKRVKIKTLLSYFAYAKRTSEIATRITEIFSERQILIRPSIMKLGDTWQQKLDDKVMLIENKENNAPIRQGKSASVDLVADTWFEEVIDKHYRTEKEVENKFIIPLLNRLGYTDDDRYDGMIIHAAHGSKATTLEVDFALFNSSHDSISAQTILVVEAKKENRLLKQVELAKAQKQVKSYAIWLGCRYGLVTDSKTIQILDLFPRINDIKIVFECQRESIKENFETIYNLINKQTLTNYYAKLNEELD